MKLRFRLYIPAALIYSRSSFNEDLKPDSSKAAKSVRFNQPLFSQDDFITL